MGFESDRSELEDMARGFRVSDREFRKRTVYRTIWIGAMILLILICIRIVYLEATGVIGGADGFLLW